jgi:pimeloyl-ACP methyl ester carboxylesterase
VYTLDLTGFGESDKPLSGYGVRNGSRLLYAFCAHFGLTRTGVIAHDLGGAMAVKLAADHPDVVGRLVLIATPADDDQIDLPTPLWLATLPVVGPIFYTLGRLVQPVRRLWMRPFVADPRDLLEEVVEDAGRSTPAAASQTLSISRREISRGRLARQARVIKIPLLLVAGEEDQIVDPQAVGAWANSVDQAEVCLLDECGHLPMIERTVEVNAQVLAFLTGDARYLEYTEAPPEGEEEVGYVEDAGADPLAPDGEATQPPDLTAPPEETSDLSSQPADPDDFEPEPREERPNVIRKWGGSYSPGDGEADPERSDATSGDGSEGEQPPRSRPRRTSPEEDVIPQLPEDLFDWPERRGEFRRERPRATFPEESGDDTDEPEYPSRS